MNRDAVGMFRRAYRAARTVTGGGVPTSLVNVAHRCVGARNEGDPLDDRAALAATPPEEWDSNLGNRLDWLLDIRRHSRDPYPAAGSLPGGKP